MLVNKPNVNAPTVQLAQYSYFPIVHQYFFSFTANKLKTFHQFPTSPPFWHYPRSDCKIRRCWCTLMAECDLWNMWPYKKQRKNTERTNLWNNRNIKCACTRMAKKRFRIISNYNARDLQSYHFSVDLLQMPKCKNVDEKREIFNHKRKIMRKVFRCCNDERTNDTKMKTEIKQQEKAAKRFSKLVIFVCATRHCLCWSLSTNFENEN